MTSDRFTELSVRTKAQAYILTELNQTHDRIRRMLAKIERDFDTPFLLSPCGELGVVVAEERALIQAARWAGCSPAEIAIVRGADHLIVEVTE